MTPLEQRPIVERLCRWVSNELDQETFETWIYQEPQLESLLGKTLYLDLLSLDYSSGQGKFDSELLIKKFLEDKHREYFQKREVISILRLMLAEEIPLVRGLRQLTRLERKGYGFIPVSFVGYESETDSVPDPKDKARWNSIAYKLAHRPLRIYRKAIIQEAKKFLKQLEAE